MRLFFAVDLDDGTKRAAEAAIEALTRALAREGGGREDALRWVAPATMHLTLHFLGDVREETVDAVRAASSAPLGADAFPLELGGVGILPPHGAPRVVWIGVTRGADALARVHAELGERLATLGLALEARAFTPHLTLARARRPPGARARRALEQAPIAPLPITTVDHVTLYESRLSPRGPSYITLARVPFAGGTEIAPARR